MEEGGVERVSRRCVLETEVFHLPHRVLLSNFYRSAGHWTSERYPNPECELLGDCRFAKRVSRPFEERLSFERRLPLKRTLIDAASCQINGMEKLIKRSLSLSFSHVYIYIYFFLFSSRTFYIERCSKRIEDGERTVTENHEKV